MKTYLIIALGILITIILIFIGAWVFTAIFNWTASLFGSSVTLNFWQVFAYHLFK